jgi:hypothetical protein
VPGYGADEQGEGELMKIMDRFVVILFALLALGALLFTAGSIVLHPRP